MAGGPIFPFSAIPVTADDVFAYIIDTANIIGWEGLGVGDDTEVAGDAIWRLRFLVPPSLPTGTPKLHCIAVANATSGVSRTLVKWTSGAAETALAAVTAEDASDELTWAAGDDDQFKEFKRTLDATTVPAAGDVVHVDLTFEGGHANWTLAQISVWLATLIWE